MKLLAQAIIKVMQEVKGMEKKSTVGTGSYAYKGTRDQDVKEVFNEALANNGLCILPIEINPTIKIERWNENGRTKQTVFTEAKTKYLLLHESGESQELAGYGQATDPQDKGAGQATTYALKNCLLYTFLTPVGKIDDTDTTHSHDITVPTTGPTELDIAIETIKGSKTLEDLQKTWSENKGFQAIYSFSNAKDARKKALS